MHQKTSKTRRRAELTLIYSVMAVAVIALVSILILVMQGYRYNKFDGKIEQGGLLQYDSQPNGGVVSIDGTRLANQTPNKITATAGDHTVTMTKEGYIDWKKDVTVKAGGILWLNYTRFIPKNKTTQPIVDFSALHAVKISRDKKFAVLKESPDTPDLTLVGLDTETPKKEMILLDPDMLEKPIDPATVAFELGEWDRDNRYVFVKYIYDGKSQWLVVDTREKKIVNNVTRELGVEATSLQFAYGSNRQIFVLTSAHELRRINLDDKSITGPLVANVEEFEQYKDVALTYTTLRDAESAKRSVGYLTLGAKTPRVVRSYTDDGSSPLRMRIGRYYNEPYVAISYGNSLEIMKGALPSSGDSATLTLSPVATMAIAGTINHLGFSPDENRHVYAQNNDRIVTYDLELNTTSTTSFASPQTQPVRWVDRYHFINNDSARVMLYEFDGRNAVEMNARSIAGMPADFSPNNKYFYLFVEHNGKPTLARIKIVL